MIAAPKSKIDFAIESIINRIENAKNGVPAETRLATQTGETVFLRPRPGASRMYPETDIPPIIVLKNELEIVKKQIPKSWNESIAELQKNYKLNLQLAEQIFDSNYLELFENICENKNNSPTFVASVLSSTITNLQRRGFNSQFLTDSEIKIAFQFLGEGKISKETIEIIFEYIMSGKSKSVESINQDRLNQILDEIIQKNSELIEKQGIRSIGPIMGIAMKELRGKADGETINKLLIEKINFRLNNKN